jgi:DNA-3-methyladenine glycosylase I
VSEKGGYRQYKHPIRFCRLTVFSHSNEDLAPETLNFETTKIASMRKEFSVIKNRRQHRAPWECTFAKEDKSKCKPGISPKSDQEYFEILCLCILQAGLSWGMIRKNWTKFKQGFYDFNIEKLAKAKKDELFHRDGVIKNKVKVEAIINNAKKFQKIREDKGSFSKFLKLLKRLGGEEAIKLLIQTLAHIGKYSAEYYLHSIGCWELK